MGDSESRGWLWLLVPDGSGNLLRPWLPAGASLHLQSQEECWSRQVSLMPVTKEVVWEKGLCQRGAGLRVQGSDLREGIRAREKDVRERKVRERGV